VAGSETIVQPPANQSQVINQLIQQLDSGNSKTRANAVESLGQMGESAKSAIPALIPLLKDQDAQVRSAAAAALKKLGYKP
jgi:HEAT repeat protein